MEGSGMTAIEWTRGDDGRPGETWNPTTGCDRVSAGCDNCYALTLAKRLKGMGSAKYQRDGDPRTSGPGFGLTVHEDALGVPLRWRKPRRVFVNSMSDLFHPKVTDEFLAKVWAVMAASPQHVFQILTKRPTRMRSLLSDPNGEFQSEVGGWRYMHGETDTTILTPEIPSWGWPLPNVHIGVSVEDQEQADRRIPPLERTPAAVRFISAEPLLGEILLGDHQRSLDWVIVGGESGPHARPMHPAWARSLRDQCETAGVPFFFKQWGEYAPTGAKVARRSTGWVMVEEIKRVGKRAAGRELDGQLWEQFPVTAS